MKGPEFGYDMNRLSFETEISRKKPDSDWVDLPIPASRACNILSAQETINFRLFFIDKI